MRCRVLLLLASIPRTPNAPHDGEHTAEQCRSGMSRPRDLVTTLRLIAVLPWATGTMYAGEGFYGAYYGADDGGSAENIGKAWCVVKSSFVDALNIQIRYPATESVASGSASLPISASVFPPYPHASAFSSAGPSTGWFPTQPAPLPTIPYYPPPPPTPNFWGNETGFPAAFTHPAGYAPNIAQQAFHGYG